MQDLLKETSESLSEYPTGLRHAIEKVERVDRVYKQLHPNTQAFRYQRKSISDMEPSGIARLVISDLDNDKIESNTGLGGVRVPLIRWLDEKGQEAPPPVEKKFAEIVGFVSDHTSLAIAERESFASNFVEIFQCKFGELEQLSTLQFSADENHRYALKILQQIKVIVKSVIDLIIQQKQGMIIAGVFQQDLNSDRLASKFRVLLSKRIDERSIRDIAFKEVKYGASTPKYSKPPQKDLLDDLNAELGKFNCTKNKTQNFVRKTNVVDLLDGPEIDHPFYRYRKHSINIDMGLRLPTYDASLTTIQTNALTKQPDQRISIYDEQKEAKNALKLKDIPEKFNFEKAEEPVLKAHSLYTRKQWEVPKIARTVKNGKYRYLQRNEPAKVDFDVIIAKSDLLRLKLIEGDQVQGQIEKCIP